MEKFVLDHLQEIMHIILTGFPIPNPDAFKKCTLWLHLRKAEPEKLILYLKLIKKEMGKVCVSLPLTFLMGEIM